jgi:hypothetical protein
MSLKVEIVDVRPIEAANRRGTLETHHIVIFRVDNGLTERLEIPMATLTREDAIEAILKHLKWKESIIGETEL